MAPRKQQRKCAQPATTAGADLYAELGLARDATVDDIKRAYRRLALQCHPDKCPGDEAANERFQRISVAYSVLSDEQKRRYYDQTGTTEGLDISPDEFLDMFQSLLLEIIGGADMIRMMLSCFTPRELARLPPFPFPKELFPPGTFPPGLRFSTKGLKGLPPQIDDLIQSGDLHSMFAAMSGFSTSTGGSSGDFRGASRSSRGGGGVSGSNSSRRSGQRGGATKRVVRGSAPPPHDPFSYGCTGPEHAAASLYSHTYGDVGLGDDNEYGGDDSSTTGSSESEWTDVSESELEAALGQQQAAAAAAEPWEAAPAMAKASASVPSLPTVAYCGQECAAEPDRTSRQRVLKPPPTAASASVSSSSSSLQTSVLSAPPQPQQQPLAQQQRQYRQTQHQQQQQEPQPSPQAPLVRDWMMAARSCDMAAMARLLEQEPLLLGCRGTGMGHTALHWCAAKGSVEGVGWLLRQGIDVNVRNDDGATPLHAAARNGRLEAIEALLSWRGLTQAGYPGTIAAAPAAATCCAPAGSVAAASGASAAAAAATSASGAAICDLTAADGEGRTALQLALQFQHMQVAALLQRVAAEREAEGRGSQTAAAVFPGVDSLLRGPAGASEAAARPRDVAAEPAAAAVMAAAPLPGIDEAQPSAISDHFTSRLPLPTKEDTADTTAAEAGFEPSAAAVLRDGGDGGHGSTSLEVRLTGPAAVACADSRSGDTEPPAEEHPNFVPIRVVAEGSSDSCCSSSSILGGNIRGSGCISGACPAEAAAGAKEQEGARCRLEDGQGPEQGGNRDNGGGGSEIPPRVGAVAATDSGNGDDSGGSSRHSDGETGPLPQLQLPPQLSPSRHDGNDDNSQRRQRQVQTAAGAAAKESSVTAAGTTAGKAVAGDCDGDDTPSLPLPPRRSGLTPEEKAVRRAALLAADAAAEREAARREAEKAVQAEAAAAAAGLRSRKEGKAWLDAAKGGNLPTLERMLAENPRLLGYQGQGTNFAFTMHTALHWAAAKGHTAVVRWLLQQGADPDLPNAAGATPLHAAASQRANDCARLLVLEAGAKMGLSDSLGDTVRDILLRRDATDSSSNGSGCGGGARLVSELELLSRVAALRDVPGGTVEWSPRAMRGLLAAAGINPAGLLERRELVDACRELIGRYPSRIAVLTSAVAAVTSAPPVSATATAVNAKANAPSSEIASSTSPPPLQQQQPGIGPGETVPAAAAGLPSEPSPGGGCARSGVAFMAHSIADDVGCDGDGEAAAAAATATAASDAAKQRGNEAFARGDYPKAVSHYTMALRLRTEPNAILYSNRAAAYCGMSYFGKAQADAEAAIRLEPRQPKYHCRLGVALLGQLHLGEAEAAFQAALQLDPSYAAAIQGLQDVRASPARNAC